MKKVYICGNPLMDMDSMPFKILPKLRAALPDLEFADFDPTENFPADDPLYIIDTVINTKEVMILDDLSRLGDAPHLSSHDADLAFHLKWLEKMGKLPRVMIFGVPAEGNEAGMVKDLVAKLGQETGK